MYSISAYVEPMEIDRKHTISDLTDRFAKDWGKYRSPNDPSRTSDRKDVNNENARMNCYLTAIVGNSGYYQSFGVKYFAQVFDITQTNTKTLDEISAIYTNPLLGREEGYKPYLKFNCSNKFLEYINNRMDECVKTKFIFAYHLTEDYKRKAREELDGQSVDGHIVSLKIRLSRDGYLFYKFIDYQKQYNTSDAKRHTINKLPNGARTPFYLFEKKQYI